MKIVCISDIHGKFSVIPHLPEGDTLIIAGDLTNNGALSQLKELDSLLQKTSFKHIVMIAGNHDWCFQNEDKQEARQILKDYTYLQDELAMIDGLYFYGSPWQPEFCNWAFNLPRGKQLQEKWNRIPTFTDVLITHGPPYGVLDSIQDNSFHKVGKSLGDQDLEDVLLDKVHPKLHVFGHIHSSHGQVELLNTIYVNASILNEMYQITYNPIVVDI